MSVTDKVISTAYSTYQKSTDFVKTSLFSLGERIGNQLKAHGNPSKLRKILTITNYIPPPVLINTATGTILGAITGGIPGAAKGFFSWGVSSYIAEQYTSTSQVGYSLATSLTTFGIQGVQVLFGYPHSIYHIVKTALTDGIICFSASSATSLVMKGVGKVREGMVKGMSTEEDPSHTYEHILESAQKNNLTEKPITPQEPEKSVQKINIETLKAQKEQFVPLLVDYLTATCIETKKSKTANFLLQKMVRPLIHFVIKKIVNNLCDAVFDQIFKYLEEHREENLDDLRKIIIEEFSIYSMQLYHEYEKVINNRSHSNTLISNLLFAGIKQEYSNYEKALDFLVFTFTNSPILSRLATTLFPQEKIESMIGNAMASQELRDQINIAVYDSLGKILETLPASIPRTNKNEVPEQQESPVPMKKDSGSCSNADEEGQIAMAIQNFFKAISYAGVDYVDELKISYQTPSQKDQIISAVLPIASMQIAKGISQMLQSSITKENFEKGLSYALETMTSLLQTQLNKTQKVMDTPIESYSEQENNQEIVPARNPPTQKELKERLTALVRLTSRIAIEFSHDQLPDPIKALLNSTVAGSMQNLSNNVLRSAGFNPVVQESTYQLLEKERQNFENCLTALLTHKQCFTAVVTLAKTIAKNRGSHKGNVIDLPSLLREVQSLVTQEGNDTILLHPNVSSEDLDRLVMDLAQIKNSLSQQEEQTEDSAAFIYLFDNLEKGKEPLKTAIEAANHISNLDKALRTKAKNNCINAIEQMNPNDTSAITEKIANFATECINEMKEIKKQCFNTQDEAQFFAVHTCIATNLSNLLSCTQAIEVLNKMYDVIEGRATDISPEDRQKIRKLWQSDTTVQETLNLILYQNWLTSLLSDHEARNSKKSRKFLKQIDEQDKTNEVEVDDSFLLEQINKQLKVCTIVLQERTQSLRNIARNAMQDKLQAFRNELDGVIYPIYSQSRHIMQNITQQCTTIITQRALGIINSINNTLAIKLAIDRHFDAAMRFLHDKQSPWRISHDNIDIILP